MKKLLTLVFVLLLCTSCSQKDILSGEIVDKEFRESYTIVGTRTQRIGNVTTIVPTTTVYPDSWNVTILDTIENEKSTTFVDEEHYSQLQIGDTVTRIDGTVTKIN